MLVGPVIDLSIHTHLRLVARRYGNGDDDGCGAGGQTVISPCRDVSSDHFSTGFLPHHSLPRCPSTVFDMFTSCQRAPYQQQVKVEPTEGQNTASSVSWLLHTDMCFVVWERTGNRHHMVFLTLLYLFMLSDTCNYYVVPAYIFYRLLKVQNTAAATILIYLKQVSFPFLLHPPLTSYIYIYLMYLKLVSFLFLLHPPLTAYIFI